MIGQTISHYRITEKLGEGGMGVVYKAEDTELDRPVALKFLAPHLLRDEEGHKRFRREAKAAAALDHPNICTVYEIAHADEHTFIVMAFLEGQPLSEKIRQGPLKLPEALSVAIQMAEGLEIAHQKGIVHRDIKPDNVMLLTGSRGLVKIMDFGLAQLSGSSKLTRGGTTLGTIAYMSPEQVHGMEVDHRSDIWSLGCVLYQMVSGKAPFRGDFDQAVVYSILNEAQEPLTAVRTGVPKELERITDKCLAKDPERRYQHADELLVDLRALKQTTETHADPSALVPATPPTTKRPAWYVVAAVMTIAVVAAIAFWLGRSGSEEEPRSDVQVSPLTTYPGLETSPTFSPDGSQVAFVWDGENEDNLDIYVKVIGSEAQLRLTQDPADDFGPAWSPDGRSIAFLRRLPEGKTGVFLTPALGGSERKVSEVNRSGLSWSPDGRWLVVAERRGPEEPSAIYLLSPTSGEKRKLTSPPSQSPGDVDGAISPNGRSLVFVREEGLQVGDLFLLNLSNDLVPEGAPKRLTSLHQQCTRPTWTVGGDAVVFTSGAPAGGRGLFKVSALQPERPRRLPFGELAEGLAIASRGNRLAFDQRSLEINIWRLQWDGAKPRVESLISSTSVDWNADYSPDGNKIVFQSLRSGASEIWVSNSDGSSPVQLTHTGLGMLTGTPRWSPDGRRIVFDSRTGGTGDIWSIDPDGGAAQQITTDPAGDLVPNWSRDGRWIYFASNRGGQFDVWKMPAAGGEQVQVTRNGGYYSEEATDGRQIYYTKSGSPGLWQMPVEGGEEVRVLDSLLGFADFAVAEDGIYFLHARSERAFVQFYSFATKEIRNVAAVDKPWSLTATIALSPDARSLLYTQADRVGSDLMLVEDFR